MEPETDQERDIRQAKLKKTCEELGLIVSGSIVVAPLAKPVAVDASAIDQQNLVASLMYLAFESGKVVASPCLLEALERCLNFIENTESEMGDTLECGEQARAAIAKAKGKY